MREDESIAGQPAEHDLHCLHGFGQRGGFPAPGRHYLGGLAGRTVPDGDLMAVADNRSASAAPMRPIPSTAVLILQIYLICLDAALMHLANIEPPS